LAIPQKFLRGQNMPMGYLDQLAVLRKKAGLTQARLAELIHVEQPTVQRWEQGKREPPLEKLFEIAHHLGVPAGSLLGENRGAPVGPSLYVKGEVVAGVWKAACEWPEEEWQSFTGRGDVNAEMIHRFGLRIVGDSMDQIYPPGTIIECVSTFGHTEIEPGKRVVIVRMDNHGHYESTVKELVEQDGEMWAVPRSYNPAHAPIKLNGPEPGIVETRIAAVVVSSVRPE
jgi:transcriptional regulator with XRE-family HTH domain